MLLQGFSLQQALTNQPFLPDVSENTEEIHFK